MVRGMENVYYMKRKIIPYNPYLKQFARDLRDNSTLSEILLWKNIKGKQMLGYDFHRQNPLGNYIVDIFCNELMLAIEIDGNSHHSEEAYKKDVLRQAELEKLGIKFLRFDDGSVKGEIQMVLEVIESWIKENADQHTPSLSRGENLIGKREFSATK